VREAAMARRSAGASGAGPCADVKATLIHLQMAPHTHWIPRLYRIATSLTCLIRMADLQVRLAGRPEGLHYTHIPIGTREDFSFALS